MRGENEVLKFEVSWVLEWEAFLEFHMHLCFLQNEIGSSCEKVCLISFKLEAMNCFIDERSSLKGSQIPFKWDNLGCLHATYYEEKWFSATEWPLYVQVVVPVQRWWQASWNISWLLTIEYPLEFHECFLLLLELFKESICISNNWDHFRIRGFLPCNSTRRS